MQTHSEMKDRMHELALKDGYIDSIFNYCDRWCERCSFTSKCRNFAFSENEPATDGPELWIYLDNVFKATMLMLEEMMEKMGIDPEEIKKMEPPDEPDPKEHPLYKKVYELSFSLHDWLQQNNPEEISSDVVDIVSPVKVRNSRFYEALEVIYWYNFFVSAKIAIIALDRLIASWSVVMENMTD